MRYVGLFADRVVIEHRGVRIEVFVENVVVCNRLRAVGHDSDVILICVERLRAASDHLTAEQLRNALLAVAVLRGNGIVRLVEITVLDKRIRTRAERHVRARRLIVIVVVHMHVRLSAER